MNATELEALRTQAPAAGVGRSVLDEWDQDQRDLIRQTIAPDASEADFQLLLDVAARTGLNPLRNEIWLAKMPGRDGQRAKFTLIVGKDGHLNIAHRHDDFRGHAGDVVRSHDVFDVLWDEAAPDGTVPKVVHRHGVGLSRVGGGDPIVDVAADGDDARGETAGEREERKRGKIVGAWAKVYREGRQPIFFYAPWTEYAPSSVSRAWRSNPSAMIRKCALDNALREAFNLSGLYSEAEMARAMERADPDVRAEPEWGTDDALAARLRELVDAARDALPGKYRVAKVRQVLSGATDDERRAFAERLEREVRDAGGEVPEQAVDAEVVPDAAEGDGS